MTRWLSLITLVAVCAHAQGKPTLVDAPLDVRMPMSAAQQAALQNDFRQVLARKSGTLVPTLSAWKAATSALKRQDCDVRDECLKQLALNASSLYALYASVQRNAAGTELTATGRVVNQDGVLSREPVRVTLPAGKDAALAVLSELVAKLQLDSLPAVLTPPPAPTPPVATAPTLELPAPPPPPPPVVVTAPAPVPEGSGGRVAAFVGFGLAGAAAATAVGFGISAAMQRSTLPLDGHLLDDAQAQTQLRVNAFATVSLASGIGAGALLVGSLILFSTSAPVSVAVAPSPGGATFALSGRFP